MKKQKTVLKLTILYMITAFIFAGCHNDDNLSDVKVQANKTPQLTLQRLTNPDISNNSKLSEKLNAINQKQNVKNAGTMAREVYNPELDFTIDTSIANYLSFGDYHSYTFPVSRTIDNGLMENVLLSLQADGTYIAYLISYDITEAERELLLNNEQIPNLNDKISSTTLLDGDWTSTILQRSGGSCWDWQIITPTCPYDGRHTAQDIITGTNNGHNCKLFTEGGSVGASYSVAISVDCEEFNGGGGYSWENPNYGNPDGNDYALPDVGGGPTDPNNSPNPNQEDECIDGLLTGFVDANGNCIPNTTVPIDPEEAEEEDDCNTSKEDLKKIFPNASDSDLQTLATVINDYGLDFGIDTKEKLQHFLAQAGHEVGGFSNGIGREESTNYTTKSRLLTIFPSYFSETDTINKRKPDNYINNSSGLANYVYCCRMGNGNEASGDGYKFRGRGIFQLTGKNNYTNFKAWYNDKYDPDKDFVSTPELIKNNDTLAIMSALWFYKNSVIDAIGIDSTTTVKAVTKKVNGGKNGLTDREERFTKAKDSITCK